MDHIESPAPNTKRYMDHIESPAPQKRYMDHIESPASNTKKTGGMFKKGQDLNVREGIIQVLSTDPYLREELARIILSDSQMLKTVIIDAVKKDQAFRNDLVKALTESDSTVSSGCGDKSDDKKEDKKEGEGAK